MNGFISKLIIEFATIHTFLGFHLFVTLSTVRRGIADDLDAMALMESMSIWLACMEGSKRDVLFERGI